MLFATFFIGMISSYLGSITPSMLNITATKISLEKGKKTASWFAVGVSFIVIFQAFFGLYFLKIINKNPFILQGIQIIAIVIFAVLSVVFFRKALHEKRQEPAKKISSNGFISGVGLSIINMFAIPFFCGVGALFDMYHLILLEPIDIVIFAIGSSLGTFFILYNYIVLAEKIKPKIARFTQYLNYILSAITGIVAIFSLVKLL